MLQNIPQSLQDLSVAEGVDFYAGTMVGLFGLGPKSIPPLEDCIKASTTIETDVEAIVATMEKGDISDILKGVMDAWDLIKTAPTELASCAIINADQMAALKKWGSILEDPTAAAKTIGANLLKNYVGILGDVADFGTKVYNSRWEPAGEVYADILIELLGPVGDVPPPKAGDKLYLY